MSEGDTLGDCPRCGGPLAMEDQFVGGRHATSARCGGCGGQWMRDSDLSRLSEVVKPVLVEWRRLPPDAVQQAVLRCPECDGAPELEKLESARDAKVVLDRCPRCGGVWLDARELQAIVRESLWSLLAGAPSPPGRG